MKSILGILFSLAILAGCNAELDLYRKVELGKPLGATDVLPSAQVPAQGQKAYTRFQTATWPLPSVWATRETGVLIDANGNVTAKVYCDTTLEHWLVLQACAMDWRMEMEIPPEAFHETPLDWKDETPLCHELDELEDIARGLSAGLPEADRHPIRYTNGLSEQYIHTRDIPVNPKRVKSDVLKRVKDEDPGLPIDIHKDIDLSGVDAKKLDSIKAEFQLTLKGSWYYLRVKVRQHNPPRNIVEYLLRVCSQFYQASEPQFPKLETQLLFDYSMVMFFEGRTQWPGNPSGHLGDFQGLTKNGFERRITFGDGVTAFIQNLGGNRIRLEFKFFRIIDPFFVIPTIECSRETPSIERRFTVQCSRSGSDS